MAKNISAAGPGATVLLTQQAYGIGGQIEIHSKRAYPTLTLDSDVADAPLTTVAAMALYRFWDGQASQAGQDDTKYSQQAGKWRVRAATLQAKHFYTQFPSVGLEIPQRSLYPFPLRVG